MTETYQEKLLNLSMKHNDHFKKILRDEKPNDYLFINSIGIALFKQLATIYLTDKDLCKLLMNEFLDMMSIEKMEKFFEVMGDELINKDKEK